MSINPEGPRTVEEVEVPDSVVQLRPQAPQPQMPQAQRPAPSANQLALTFRAIAAILAADFQCLLLVGAMIFLSGAAVLEPTELRLIGAAGFDLFALAGVRIVQNRIPKRPTTE